MSIEEVVKVTRNYQVTIPARIRKYLGIREGDYIKFIYDPKEKVIKIIPYRRKRTTIRLGRRINVEEMEKAVEEFVDEAIT